jgi:hypothetical protein
MGLNESKEKQPRSLVPGSSLYLLTDRPEYELIEESRLEPVHKHQELGTYQRSIVQNRKQSLNSGWKPSEVSTTNVLQSSRPSQTRRESYSQSRSQMRSVEQESGSFVGSISTPGMTQRTSISTVQDSDGREKRRKSRARCNTSTSTVSIHTQSELSLKKPSQQIHTFVKSSLSVDGYLELMRQIHLLVQKPLEKWSVSMQDIFTLAISKQTLPIVPATSGRLLSEENRDCVILLKAKYAEGRRILAQTIETLPPTTRVTLPPLILEDCSFYSGEWLHGVMDGQGLQVYPDGSKYAGQWKAGKAHGSGDFVTSLGRYSGLFERGKAHGRGVYETCDGNRLEGEWSDDLISGLAVESRPDGYRLEVRYFNGKREGQAQGILSPGVRFRVTFNQDKIISDYHVEFQNGNRYIGGLLDGQMHGKGSFEWSDGRKYRGEYKYDLKDGYGEFTFTDGKIYRGHWEAGKQHGEGSIIYPSGETKSFIWKNGFKVKY